MNKITIFKILILIVIAILVLAFIGYISFIKIKEYRIARVVKNGQIVIDKAEHDWGIIKSSISNGLYFKPVTIEMYIRNTSQYNVEGGLVFFVVLNSNGLEQEYLKIIDKPISIQYKELLEELNALEKNLKESSKKQFSSAKEKDVFVSINEELKKRYERDVKEFEKLLLERPMNAKDKSIHSWFERGEKLKEGMDYEPIENGGENYYFTFKKHVSLIPGELIKITHEQPIPPEVRGYLLKVKIEDIIF